MAAYNERLEVRHIAMRRLWLRQRHTPQDSINPEMEMLYTHPEVLQEARQEFRKQVEAIQRAERSLCNLPEMVACSHPECERARALPAGAPPCYLVPPHTCAKTSQHFAMQAICASPN